MLCTRSKTLMRIALTGLGAPRCMKAPNGRHVASVNALMEQFDLEAAYLVFCNACDP